MDTLSAIILAIVEGITEYLPVSSTGHMIIVGKMLAVEESDFTKAYLVNIQFGAILSVVVLYWKKFLKSLDFYFKLLVGFLPAAVIGFLLNDFIDKLLESALVVGITLLLGGVILLFVDKWFKYTDEDKEVDYPSALKIGFFQCIAMIPGVSRSAASIIGGMAQGLTRTKAAEFSFFLAVPTMFAASAYKLLKNPDVLSGDNLTILLIGNVIAFVVAMMAIKFFIGYLQKYGFKVFGYYRIVIGIIILVMLSLGYDLSVN